MPTKYTDLTYNELMKLAPRDKPFQVVTKNYPRGKVRQITSWAVIKNRGIEIIDPEDKFGEWFICPWIDYLKGETFDLIVHHLDDTTLEQYQVGDEVEVLDKLVISTIDYTGKRFKIIDTKLEPNYTASYVLDVSDIKLPYLSLPTYCLRKVITKKDNTRKTITIGGDTFEVTEELTNALKNLKKLN